MSAAFSRWAHRLLAGLAAPELAAGLQAQLQPAASLCTAVNRQPPARPAHRPVRRLQGVRA